MLTRVHSARAFIARGLAAAFFAAFTFVLIGFSGTAAQAEPKDIKWGTGPVGSVGHKALVVLADLLNKEMPDYRITVLPMPGAVMTVKGFATDQIDAMYGSDDALREFAADSGRFKGFKATMKRQPVQSMWMFTLDVGLAIKASNADKIKKWGDLTGKNVYTGPLPFDTRLHLENALAAVGVKHIYTQVDLSTVGSQLDAGSIDAMIVYYTGGTVPAPWLSQASLAVDWAGLNPSADELATLKKKGFAIEEADAAKISKKDIHVKKLTLLAVLLGLRHRHEHVDRRRLQDADHRRQERRQSGQARRRLRADRRRQARRFPGEGAGADLGPRPDPSRPCEIPEGKGPVERKVGLQSRHDVIA